MPSIQEDIDVFLNTNGTSPEAAIGGFNELYSKYKYMESSFEKSKSVYKSKLPEIEQTLDMIRLLKTKREEDEEMFINYSLCDTIYAKAQVMSPFHP